MNHVIARPRRGKELQDTVSQLRLASTSISTASNQAHTQIERSVADVRISVLLSFNPVTNAYNETVALFRDAISNMRVHQADHVLHLIHQVC